MKRWRFVAAVVLAALLSACQFFGPSTAEMTLSVQNQVLGTEIAALRATATVEADRMLVTLEHAQTAVSHVNGQTGDLQATLMASGGQPADLASISPQAPMAFSPPPPILDIDPQTQGGVAPIRITPGVTAAISNPGDGGAALVITPLATQSESPLSNIVMAEAVGSDDCAVQALTSFTTQTSQIYVVATARNIGTQDTVRSLWSRDGQAVVDYTWTPKFQIEGACIWFYIDQSVVEFTPGTWQVQMELNGQNVGSPAVFTIAGGQAAGDQALQESLGS